MAVVLPAPLGPSSTVMRPFGARIVRCESAGTRQNALETARTSTTRSFGSIWSTAGAGGALGAAGGRGGVGVAAGAVARAAVVVSMVTWFHRQIDSPVKGRG